MNHITLLNISFQKQDVEQAGISFPDCLPRCSRGMKLTLSQVLSQLVLKYVLRNSLFLRGIRAIRQNYHLTKQPGLIQEDYFYVSIRPIRMKHSSMGKS